MTQSNNCVFNPNYIQIYFAVNCVLNVLMMINLQLLQFGLLTFNTEVKC